MLGRFPPQILYKFPRMSPADTEIWKRFLPSHGINYDRFDYDLSVGMGEDPGPDFPDYLRDDFIHLTKKRIDAVGYKDNAATIFEVKPRANPAALGQLLVYKSLFIKSYPDFSQVNLAVVSEFINTEEKNLFLSNNIAVYIV